MFLVCVLCLLYVSYMCVHVFICFNMFLFRFLSGFGCSFLPRTPPPPPPPPAVSALQPPHREGPAHLRVVSRSRISPRRSSASRRFADRCFGRIEVHGFGGPGHRGEEEGGGPGHGVGGRWGLLGVSAA